MALTPDDVLNKRFETTRFRDGYDQDEVDDYLDEVVTEFRSMIAEKERLEQENETLRARIAELEGGDAAPAAPAEAAQPQATEPVAAEAEPESTPAAAALVTGAPAESAGQQEANGLLALAQRVHDEYVRDGEAKRDELVREAEVKSEEIDKAAQNRKAELESEFDKTKQQLETRKSELESKIDELKSFERDYRLKLRGYIESQLRDLDRSSSLAYGTDEGVKER